MTHEIEKGTLQQLQQTVQELRKERADAKEVIAVLTARTDATSQATLQQVKKELEDVESEIAELEDKIRLASST